MWLARGSEHLLLARAAAGNEDVSTSTPRLLATEIGPVQGAGKQGASGVCEDKEAQGGEDAEGHKPEENRECEEGWVEESGDPRDVAAKRRRRAAAESSVRGGESASGVGSGGEETPCWRERGKKIKNCNLTCGSYVLGKNIGDLLKHLPQYSKKAVSVTIKTILLG